MPACLDHINAWVFDLDNTLYPASANVFAQMDERMGQYVAQMLNIDLGQARTIQKRYFREHGTTLSGLMKEHQVDPQDYLHFVHDVPLDRIEPDLALAKAIAALPGRKLVYTNATSTYARRVLDKRGLANCFEAIYDIQDAEYRPKPEVEPYRAFCESHAVDPARAVMFEDMARNLRPAKSLGMLTVWINNGSELGDAEACPSFIDHETHDLGHWLARYFPL